MNPKSSDGSTSGTSDGDDPANLSNRARRTRAAIVDAALVVFNERGYHNTRITDITDAAEVAVGTFYTYFDTKEEVFEVVLESVEAEVLDSPQRPRGVSPMESIQETNRLYLEAFRRNARFWAMLEEAAMSNALAREVIISRQMQSRARTERALRRWMAADLIPQIDDIPFTAEALGAVTERCAYLWFVFGDGIDLERATERLTMVWRRMLRMDEHGYSDGTAPTTTSS
ncbi:MAG: TetR/AcrR family transcriptional regulator [Acidimicrobiales bacterium]|nr:TetR/AcrR family transcriptional regulator [Acidimicrobiales bacterium]